MNLIYSTDTKEFSPISHGDTYLYEKYFRIFSFLKTKLKDHEINHLAQPIVKGTMVDWHGNYANKMTALASFDASIQQSIESSYVELLSKTKRISKELLSSGDDEKMAWGKLISETFDTENNILITDGQEWAIIWGWQFRNKLNFANADFMSDQYVEPAPIVPGPAEIASNNMAGNTPPIIAPITMSEEKIETFSMDGRNEMTEETEAEEEAVMDPPSNTPPVVEKSRMGFWQHIKRFFRWLAYRFWGLMMLIIYTLLILCLCKKCHHHEPDCSQYQKIERDLKYLEGIVKGRCDGARSNPVKP
jgi:hypothetical protein